MTKYNICTCSIIIGCAVYYRLCYQNWYQFSLSVLVHYVKDKCTITSTVNGSTKATTMENGVGLEEYMWIRI